MPLNATQIKLISFIDKKVKNILADGGNEISVMISLLDEMPKIKILINSATREELEKYCDSHEGFYLFMKILEDTAAAIASYNGFDGWN